MNTNQKGTLAESKIIADLIFKGLYVYIGFGDSPVDLIAMDLDGELYRIQVKYCSLKKNAYVDIHNYIITTKNGKLISQKYSENDFDIVAVYIPELDECLYINNDIINKVTVFRIRINRSKNNQIKNINYKKEFSKFPKRT